jgi:uncharacterized protein (DUF1778 family)
VEVNVMDKKRIQVYANEEMKRRIELAAAKQQLAVTEYCLAAITQQLADDNLLEEEQVAISVKLTKDEPLMADLRTLRESILARRGGRPITLDILE